MQDSWAFSTGRPLYSPDVPSITKPVVRYLINRFVALSVNYPLPFFELLHFLQQLNSAEGLDAFEDPGLGGFCVLRVWACLFSPDEFVLFATGQEASQAADEILSLVERDLQSPRIIVT